MLKIKLVTYSKLFVINGREGETATFFWHCPLSFTCDWFRPTSSQSLCCFSNLERYDLTSEEKTSSLQLVWKRREGGGGGTQRDYLDFVVDGESLSEKIGGDLVSCLGWFVPSGNALAVRRLLLEEKSQLPDNRLLLYVCPECGELDCGAITAIVERKDGKVIWRDFAFVNGYDEIEHSEKITEVESFAFDRRQYRNAFKGLL